MDCPLPDELERLRRTDINGERLLALKAHVAQCDSCRAAVASSSASFLTGTHPSLLLRVRDPQDHAAWRDFVERYGPKVYGWARQRGLQTSDAEDVTQDVLSKLLLRLKNYEYREGRFRAWLKMVTRNTLVDYVNHRKRAGQGKGDDAAFDQLASLPAREDLYQRLRQEFDGELVHFAMEMTRSTVTPQSWNVFRLRSDDSLPYDEIARRLQITDVAARVAYGRVLKKVQENLRKLNEPNDEEPEV